MGETHCRARQTKIAAANLLSTSTGPLTRTSNLNLRTRRRRSGLRIKKLQRLWKPRRPGRFSVRSGFFDANLQPLIVQASLAQNGFQFADVANNPFVLFRMSYFPRSHPQVRARRPTAKSTALVQNFS